MARRHDGQQFGKVARERPVHRHEDRLLARMRARRDPDRPARHEPRRARHDARIGGGRGRVELQVAGNQDARRAEPFQPLPVGGALGDAEREAPEQGACRALQPLPAPERAFGETSVDEEERHPAPFQLHDEVGPELGFGEEREARAPVIEEPAHVTRYVERHELVQGTGGQPLGDEVGGGAGARGHEHGEPLARQALHEGQDRQGLPEARAMHPDQVPARAHPARAAAPLAQPRPVLLALAPAPGEQHGGRGLQHGESRPVGAQKRGQGRVHAGEPLSCVRRDLAPGSAAPTMA
jgi:hypothetical protein